MGVSRIKHPVDLPTFDKNPDKYSTMPARQSHSRLSSFLQLVKRQPAALTDRVSLFLGLVRPFLQSTTEARLTIWKYCAMVEELLNGGLPSWPNG
jgi:hypothetical protein